MMKDKFERILHDFYHSNNKLEGANTERLLEALVELAGKVDQAENDAAYEARQTFMRSAKGTM